MKHMLRSQTTQTRDAALEKAEVSARGMGWWGPLVALLDGRLQLQLLGAQDFKIGSLEADRSGLSEQAQR